jgi:ABC-type uncharacterized transport system ATPase subunit
LIYILDHPFTGASKVSTKPLAQAMATMRSQSAAMQR